MILFGEISILFLYHFHSDHRFPPFLLYVRWKSGVTFVRRCFRDDLVESIYKLSNKIRDFRVNLFFFFLKKYPLFCFFVAIFDLVYDVEAGYILPSLTASSIWKSFLEHE